jgi:hypothetical protein
VNGIQHIREAALNEIRIGDNSELSENNGLLDTDIEQWLQHLMLSFSIDGDMLSSEHASQFRSEGVVAPCAIEAEETSRDSSNRVKRSVA